VRRTGLALLLGTLLAGLTVVPAAAAPGGNRGAPTSLATYHGRTIDLSKSWDTATACAVVSAQDVRCFDSADEMNAAVGTSSPEAASTSTSPSLSTTSTMSTATLSCSGWLYLYDGTNFTGRYLAFHDEGYWQNLSAWGFDNQMSSWWNNTGCTAYASWDANGGGAYLVMSAYSSQAYLGSWDNQASAIYIS
jgi:hypothetical protein